MWCHYNAVTFLTNFHKRHPIDRPLRASYGVSSLDPTSDWYFVTVPLIIYVISYNIGPHYNSTGLYCWMISYNPYEWKPLIQNLNMIIYFPITAWIYYCVPLADIGWYCCTNWLQKEKIGNSKSWMMSFSSGVSLVVKLGTEHAISSVMTHYDLSLQND